MRVSQMSHEARKEMLLELVKHVVDKDDEMLVENCLDSVVDHMDELDDNDFFGTEGWRHRYGYED